MQQKVMYESFWELSQNLERYSKTRGCTRNQKISKHRTLTDKHKSEQTGKNKCVRHTVPIDELRNRHPSALGPPSPAGATEAPRSDWEECTAGESGDPEEKGAGHSGAHGRQRGPSAPMGDGGGCGGTGASTPARGPMGSKRGEETSIGNPLARRGLSGGGRLPTDHPSLPWEAGAVWGGRRSRGFRETPEDAPPPQGRQLDHDSTGEFAPRIRGCELGRKPPWPDEFHGRSKGTRDTRGGGDGEEE